MKLYHIFFLCLKIAIIVQFALILFNKESTDDKVYLFTEIIFKLSLGIFIEYLMFHENIPGLIFEDKVIVSFAGGLLMYDAITNDLPILLKKYGITFSFSNMTFTHT